MFLLFLFNSTNIFLKFPLPFLLTLCKNLALPPPSVYCSLLSWAPWFMMFVFSLLTIWGLLILSSISWSLWRVTLHLDNLNLFFHAGQKHSQRPLPLLAFFSFCSKRYVTIILCYWYVPASLFSKQSGWWKSPPQTCPVLFIFLPLPRKCIVHLIFVTRPKTWQFAFTFNISAGFYSFFIPSSPGIQNNISYPWYTDNMSFDLFFGESWTNSRHICLLNN